MNDEDKYLAAVDLSRLPPQAKAMLIGLGQYQDGKPINQQCPKCGGAIHVEDASQGDKPSTAWLISCPCGMCRNTLRGL